MLCETYARKNLKPPASPGLISDLYTFIRNQNCGEMLVARTPDDEIACARIIIWDPRQAYGWTAASDSRYLNSGATYLLRFETLKRLKERGIMKMNLMMANVPDLSESVVHLNPTLVPYYQVQTWIFDTILRRKT
jgi:hypothetical protein